MSHRPLWISKFTEPSSRIFNRRDWQTSSFTTLARFITPWTLSGFSRSALRIFSRSFSMAALCKRRNADGYSWISFQIIASLILPPSKVSAARASRAIFSMVGQFVRRYFCAWTFVGKLVCRMQPCRAFPFAIWKDTVWGPSLISCSVGLGSFRMDCSFMNFDAVAMKFLSRVKLAGG